MSHVSWISQIKPPNLIERCFNPANGLRVFAAAIAVVYGLVPLGIYIITQDDAQYMLLACISCVCVIAMWFGYRISIFDYRFKSSAKRLSMSSSRFISLTWIIFGLFLLVTLTTAATIPILSALAGVEGGVLSQERGDFLKGREGAGIILLYLSTFLVNTVVPYSIILLYQKKAVTRHLAASVFFLFCISFMQKTLFFNLVLPIMAFLALTRRLRGPLFMGLAVSSILLIIATTFLSLRGEQATGPSGNYLTALYAPVNPLDYFFWRAVSVPVFTAADSLVVHGEQFGGRPLLGATSSFIAGIFGLERVNIERYVFEHQFGSWNEIANSNAVFVVDAFVNFGWLGVIFFGLFVGQVFRWFRISPDPAFRALWPVFAFVLFSAPLIGMLLSNGFAYMLFHALYIRVRTHARQN